jgi:hypothetical protein
MTLKTSYIINGQIRLLPNRHGFGDDLPIRVEEGRRTSDFLAIGLIKASFLSKADECQREQKTPNMASK